MFVENRIKEILKETDVTFRYVPSNENLADFPTRGLSVMEMEAKLWWYGPSWLKNSEERWPEWCEPQSIKEVKITTPKVFYEMTSVTSHKVDGKAEIYSLCDVDDKRYSSLRKLLRITIYCLKFIKQMVWLTLSHLTKTTIAEKHKLIAHVLNSLADNFSICAGNIKVVTLLWVHFLQYRQFADVFIAIKKNRKYCLMRQLGLRIDELGILRCCGCFLNVEVKESSKSPKLLPRHERFTRLLIMEVHE